MYKSLLLLYWMIANDKKESSASAQLRISSIIMITIMTMLMITGPFEQTAHGGTVARQPNGRNYEWNRKMDSWCVYSAMKWISATSEGGSQFKNDKSLSIYISLMWDVSAILCTYILIDVWAPSRCSFLLLSSASPQIEWINFGWSRVSWCAWDVWACD